MAKRAVRGLSISALAIWACVAAAAEPEQGGQPAAEPLDCVINPSVVADLGSGVPGIVSAINVDRSDFVKAGDVLAELESGVEIAALNLAGARAAMHAEVDLRRVNAAFGRRQHQRSKDLFKRKVISSNDIDERETQARQAGIQLQQAVENKELAELELVRAAEILKRRTIKSPISGVVMERFSAVGEYVEDQPVVRVAQLDPLYVEVFVPVAKLGEIEPGMHAEVWSDAVKNTVWEAEVSRVDRVADVASGTYGVRLLLPNPDHRIPAGLRCRLNFQARTQTPMAADLSDVPAEQSADRPVNASEPAKTVLKDNSPVSKVSMDKQATSEPAAFCAVAGPFEESATAERAAEVLRQRGLGVRIDTVEMKKHMGYRLDSDWFASRGEATAFVRRLQGAGITDHHLIQRSKLPIRVALGFYKSDAQARQRVGELKRHGFKAHMRAWRKSVPVYELAISGSLDGTSTGALADLPTFLKDKLPQSPSRGRIASR